MSEWRRVNKAAPCPACDRPDWCAWTAEGWLKCERTTDAPPGMARVVLKDGGALFKPEGDAPHTMPPKATTSPSKARAFETVSKAVESLNAQHGQPWRTWHYTDASGDPVGAVIRWGAPGSPKTIRPLRRDSDGWRCGAMDAPRPLYRLADLLAADPDELIWVGEGERAADALHAAGLLATTNAHGCKAAHKTDWTPLHARAVVICPDRDEPGEAYARVVAQLAHDAGASSVRIVRLCERWPDLPPGGDAADLIDAMGVDAADAYESLRAMAAEAKCVSFAIEVAANETNPRGVQIVSIATLEPASEPDWVWPGYIARGGITLLSALPKAGKSTLTAHLLRDLSHGGPLVGERDDSPTLILSEEPSFLWAARREALRLPASTLICQRDSFGKPCPSEWADTIGAMGDKIKAEGVGLCVIDTLGALWCCSDENDSSATLSALTPIRALSEAGAGVLLVHHSRKSEGSNGTAHRGSNAIAGFADCIAELRFYDTNADGDQRRTIVARGRFPGIVPEWVYELTEAGYVPVGNLQHTRGADLDDAIAAMLPDAGPWFEADKVHAEWPHEPKPGRTNLRQALNKGAEAGKWDRMGTGKKGDAFLYGRAFGTPA